MNIEAQIRSLWRELLAMKRGAVAVVGGGGGGSGITALTGDVTASGTGSVAATIANDAVSNAKAANMADATIKGRAVGAGTGDPTDLTGTQATAILSNVVGDTGTGGTKGLVPAPAAGDAAAGKFLKADGTFAVPPGTGGSYTDEQAQDAIGAMVDTSLVYVDATPLLTRAALTGDVTASQGSNATTIANDAVTNAKAANMAADTIKGRAHGAGTGDPTDLTANQVSDVLDTATDPFLRTSAGGSGITQLTGDVTAGPGSGSQAATLATSGVSAGTYGNGTNVAQVTVDAKGRVTAASNVPITPAITAGSDDYIQILRPGSYSQSPSHIGGSYTVGQAFKPFRNMNITGAEFVLPGTLSGKNVKVSLWDPSGPTQLQTVTVTGVTTGSNVATFASAQAVTLGTEYRLGMWVTDGSGYSKASDMPVAGVTAAIQYTWFGYYSSGDAMPATTTAAEQYPLNPTIS